MITLISFGELKVLLREGKLSQSSNLEFLDANGLSFLKTEFRNRTGKEAGLILYLFSLKGKEIQDVSEEVLQTHTNDLISNLSLPEGEAILVSIKPGVSLLKLERSVFEELVEFDLSDEVERKVARTMLDKDGKDSGLCTYALADSLSVSNVKGIFFHPHMSDEILSFQEEIKKRNIALTPTSLFSKL